jgi:hypothetical protein
MKDIAGLMPTVGIAAAVATLVGYTMGLLYGSILRVLFTGSLYGFSFRVLSTGSLCGFSIWFIFRGISRNYCTHHSVYIYGAS